MLKNPRDYCSQNVGDFHKFFTGYLKHFTLKTETDIFKEGMIVS